MSIIKFAEGQDPQESQWNTIGKAWNHKTKPGMISIRIGVKKNINGTLVDQFEQITLKPDDVMVLRPNTRKREDKKDPDFSLALLVGETKGKDEVKEGDKKEKKEK